MCPLLFPARCVRLLGGAVHDKTPYLRHLFYHMKAGADQRFSLFSDGHVELAIAHPTLPIEVVTNNIRRIWPEKSCNLRM